MLVPFLVVGNPDTPSSTHRLDTNAIIHGTSDSLFAAKVSLGRLDRDVAEQELDLFQFSSAHNKGVHMFYGDRVARVFSISAFRAYSRTTCQTAFSVNPAPQAFPALLTRRNTFPLIRPAA